MTKIFLLLLIPFALFSQDLYMQPFTVGTDTVGSITTADSVYVQFYDSPYYLLTSCTADTAMVTGDDKVGEVTKVFMLAREDFWTHTGMLRFKILNTGQDTVISSYVPVGNIEGAVTLFIKPDTVGTYVDYGNSWVEGN